MITPVRRTTPRKSLEIIYDVLPLDLQGKLEAISTLKRNKNILKLRWSRLHPDKKKYIGHRLHWQCMTDDTDYDLVRVAPDCNLSYWEDRNGDSTWAVLFSGGCRP